MCSLLPDGISYCQTLLFSFWYEVKGLQTFSIPCSDRQTTSGIREKNDCFNDTSLSGPRYFHINQKETDNNI